MACQCQEIAEGVITQIDSHGKQKLDKLCKPELEIFPSFITCIKGQDSCLADAKKTFTLPKACLKTQQVSDEHKIVKF